jgi:alanyl-tRNA synthetase
VEFVCGKRAVATARRDFAVLSEAGGLYSSHIWELPQQIRKAQEELKASRKGNERTLEELASLYAMQLLAETAEFGGRKIVVRTFADRDLSFIKLLAQRLTRQSANVVALLASTSGQPSLVFAASPGQPFDMGALMKDALAKLGGRGGGSKDMAQGGPAQIEGVDSVLAEIAATLRK